VVNTQVAGVGLLLWIKYIMPFTIPTTNPWSCLPASFAMACEVPFQTIVGLIGHDGSDLPYTNKKYRAGFHPQECLEAATKLGWLGALIELFPRITPDGVEERVIQFGGDGNWARFLQHLRECSNGVIEGVSVSSGLGHAVAWDGYHIYDPKGMVYSFSEHYQRGFNPRLLWKLVRNGGTQ
jgi:hypothetical protein